ncbi:MAG: DUF402 domain-containing protein [Lachnospiraceae bacterium]|nr:DUF402 domain-containing protein [Lachnospiraceae bacterium]
MSDIRLFRKRLIPLENIELKDDIVDLVNDDIILSHWHVLKPRKDIDRGISVYYLKKGIKISKEFDAKGNLVYYYCDIIDTDYNDTTKVYTFTDLLVDVLVYPDNSVKIVDLDEFAEALELSLISTPQVGHALKITDDLLKHIYNNEFDELIKPITDIEAGITW